MVIPVSPPAGVQSSEHPSDFLHRDPHVVTGDTASHALGSNTSGDGNGNDSSHTHNRATHLEMFINTPLQLGQTLVVYHPHSQHPPEIINTPELTFPREPRQSLLPVKPWAPFTSRDDFEQAELFIKHNCTNRHINDQLCLNHKRSLHNQSPGGPPSMKNAREMHKILDKARSDLDISLVR